MTSPPAAELPDPVRNAFAGRRVAVLGAGGFMGRWVAHWLSRCDADLFLVVRDGDAMKHIAHRHRLQGQIVETDLAVKESPRQVLASVRPSITFNLVGYGVDPDEADETRLQQINASLVRDIATAVAAHRDPAWAGADLVHVGSALEYGDAGGDLAEDGPTAPVSPYGKTKLAGTRYLLGNSKSMNLKSLTARSFTVYGPGEHPERLLPALLASARTGRPVGLTRGDQRRDFTYVEDVASGLLRLGCRPAAAPGATVVNLATGTLSTVRSFVETAAQVLGIPHERLTFGEREPAREEITHAPVSLARLRRMVGWQPATSVAAGVARTRDFEMDEENQQQP